MKQVTTTKLDRWLTAMRLPGLYQQMRGAYCDAHGFCGLGVMAAEAGLLTDEVKEAYFTYVLGCRGSVGNSAIVTATRLGAKIQIELEEMMVEIGLTDEHAKVLVGAVPQWNDRDRLTLPQIGERIEAKVALFRRIDAGLAELMRGQADVDG